jgi:hypothetical protein
VSIIIADATQSTASTPFHIITPPTKRRPRTTRYRRAVTPFVAGGTEHGGTRSMEGHGARRDTEAHRGTRRGHVTKTHRGHVTQTHHDTSQTRFYTSQQRRRTVSEQGARSTEGHRAPRDTEARLDTQTRRDTSQARFYTSQQRRHGGIPMDTRARVRSATTSVDEAVSCLRLAPRGGGTRTSVAARRCRGGGTPGLGSVRAAQGSTHVCYGGSAC